MWVLERLTKKTPKKPADTAWKAPPGAGFFGRRWRRRASGRMWPRSCRLFAWLFCVGFGASLCEPPKEHGLFFWGERIVSPFWRGWQFECLKLLHIRFLALGCLPLEKSEGILRKLGLASYINLWTNFIKSVPTWLVMYDCFPTICNFCIFFLLFVLAFSLTFIFSFFNWFILSFSLIFFVLFPFRFFYFPAQAFLSTQSIFPYSSTITLGVLIFWLPSVTRLNHLCPSDVSGIFQKQIVREEG